MRRHLYYVVINSASSAVKLFAGKSSLSFLARTLKAFGLFRFEVLFEIAVVDMPEKPRRFRAVYSFLSLLYGERLFLNLYLVEATLVNSLRAIYPSSG